MADEHNVKIKSWPEEPATLSHRFDADRPCPVSIQFEDSPARVQVTTGEQTLAVDMSMAVSAKEPIPVCIKVCEPICARSSYRIGITVFDQPVAQISLQGETRLFNCDEGSPVEPVCVDFSKLKSEIEFRQPFTHDDLVFEPLGDPIRTSEIGDPPGQVKLTFPASGIRIELPQSSNDVSTTVSNYSNPRLEFRVFAGTTLVNQFNRDVDRRVEVVSLSEVGVTAIEVRGGDNEASVIEVCYTPVG